MTRALIADPELPAKAREGRRGRDRPLHRLQRLHRALPRRRRRSGVRSTRAPGARARARAADRPQAGARLVVVGGGPAGLDRRSRGRTRPVTRWSSSSARSGRGQQIALAGAAPGGAAIAAAPSSTTTERHARRRRRPARRRGDGRTDREPRGRTASWSRRAPVRIGRGIALDGVAVAGLGRAGELPDGRQVRVVRLGRRPVRPRRGRECSQRRGKQRHALPSRRSRSARSSTSTGATSTCSGSTAPGCAILHHLELAGTSKARSPAQRLRPGARRPTSQRTCSCSRSAACPSEPSHRAARECLVERGRRLPLAARRSRRLCSKGRSRRACSRRLCRS